MADVLAWLGWLAGLTWVAVVWLFWLAWGIKWYLASALAGFVAGLLLSWSDDGPVPIPAHRWLDDDDDRYRLRAQLAEARRDIRWRDKLLDTLNPRWRNLE